MAIASGKESTNEVEVKRYIGVAPVFVMAVNPTKEKLSEIYDRDIEKDPEYLSEKDGVKSIRIDFIVKTNEERCGVKMISKVSFFVRNECHYNKEKTKAQIIDKYGRTAWGTIDEIKNKEIPSYSSGKANIDADYRVAFNGEEELTNFIKTFLNIPPIQVYNKKTEQWEINSNPAECEARLDNIKDYFTGNISEIETAIKSQPNNQIKVLFGVKKTDDNKMYQDVFLQKMLLSNSKNYNALEKALAERKELGSYPNTEFQVCDIKEYSIEPTIFGKGSEDTQSNDVEVPW